MASILVAAATLVLAIATWRMADQTRKEATETGTLATHAQQQLDRADQQLKLTTEALDATVLPLLVDVPPTSDAERDSGAFGAPGRRPYDLSSHQVYIRFDTPHEFSAPLRNVGAGVAFIQQAWTEPELPGSLDISSRVVRTGERTRINIVLPDHAYLDDDVRNTWSSSFVIAVLYVDARGGQTMVTRAHIGTYATSGTLVRGITVTRAGEDRPFLEAGQMNFP
jgi:hypothetical protein